MADQKGLAQAALVAKLAADHLASFGKAAKAELLDLMVDNGSTQNRVLAADGLKMGTVSRAGGDVKAAVTDPAKFLAWVIERHPGEIVQSVRESFVRAMLARADEIGEPVDPQGEVMAGVEYVESTTYLTVRPSTAAKERMAALLGDAEWMRQLPAGNVRPEPATQDTSGS